MFNAVLHALRYVVLAAALISWGPAAAQQSVDYDYWNTLAERAQAAINEPDVRVGRLGLLRNQLVARRSAFEEAQSANAAQIATLEEQLGALGAAPAEGETEDPEIANRREELVRLLAELQAPILRAQEAELQANGLIGQIDGILRDRQADWILTRSASPLSPQGWPAAVTALRDAAGQVATSFRSSIGSPSAKAQRWADLPMALGLLVVGVGLLLRGGSMAERLGQVARNITRRGTGVWTFIVSLAYIILPLIGVLALTWALITLSVLDGAQSDLLLVLPTIAVVVSGAGWLARQMFPVGEEGLTSCDPGFHGAINRLILAAAVLMSLRLVFDQLDLLNSWDDGVLNRWLFPVLVLEAVLLWRLGRLIRPAPSQGDLEPDATFARRFLSGTARMLPIVAIAAPALALLGYNNAGQALMLQTEKTLAVFALVVVFQRFLANVWVLISKDTEAGRDGLVPTLLGFVLALAALPVLALIWGARTTDLSELWQKFVAGFAIGDTRISPSVFITFAIVFTIGYMVTRLVQSALRSSVLPKTRLDTGGQNAVVSGLGYIGIFLAALIAINTAGLDLSGLAIVAGALSVGIGFGLQNVVSNFVSGIILLIERPISIGDWIEVGGKSGYVRSISVRSTRIETFDRQDVIVPNADFVSNPVTNYTRGNTVGRLIVPVGVAYGTDTRHVEQLLKSVVEDLPFVMAYPAPFVVFQGFGASTYDMELRVYLRDVNNSLSSRTEINHRIREVFERENIEIAFPQQDIWFRNAPEAPDAG